MKSRVNLVDVAAHAGVSRATASLVLRGTGRVSESTRRRVFESMRSLGYVYNRNAASLRTATPNTISALVTSVSNPVYAEYVEGFESRVAEAGFVTIVANTGKDATRQEALLTALREQDVAGITVAPAPGSEFELAARLREWGLPHVLMTNSMEPLGSSSVGHNDTEVGYVAARHLIEVHGCRTIAYVGGPAGFQSRVDRSVGIRRALHEGGREATDLTQIAASGLEVDGYELGRQLLALGGLPDGIFCHSDMVALGLFRALHDEGIWNLPVIGNGDIPAGALWEPPLTTVATGTRELGQEAARLLLHQIEHPRSAPETFRPAPDVIVRRSCGCSGP